MNTDKYDPSCPVCRRRRRNPLGPGHLRSPAEDAELTRLLREWDRITARIEQLGVKMPERPGAVTMREWEEGK